MTISNPNQRPRDSQSLRSQTVVGVFHNREKTEAALDDLLAAGFEKEDIGVVSRTDHGDWPDYIRAGSTNDPATTAPAPTNAATTTGEKIATGAVAGASIGGLWGLGIAAGALPAIGPVIAGGVLAGLLSSAVAGAAAGGMVAGLIGLGISEEDAHYYEREIVSGRVVLTIRAGTRHREAASILRAHGAYDIEDSAIPVDEI